MNINTVGFLPFCVSWCINNNLCTILGLGPRKFRSTYAELGDRSVWTDTPADKEKKAATAAAATGMIGKVACQGTTLRFIIIIL